MDEEKPSRLKSAASSLGQQALGVGARRLLGQGLSRAGAALGSAFGPVGTVGGAVLGWAASNKYVLGAAAGGAAAFFILILLPVIIFVAIFGLGGGEIISAQEAEVLSVTKSADPPKIDKNAPPTEVTYEIVVKNISGSIAVKNIKISDGSLGLEKTIGDLDPGASYVETVKDTITNTATDSIVTNTVVVTGVVPSTGQSGAGLNYYIPYGDTSIVPEDAGGVKTVANSRYPDNNIDKPCPGGVTCWDYVIAQSKASGISPAFAIAIWWEEGGFGGLVDGSRSSAQFGCGYYPDDFQGAFNCFLDFTSKDYPYDPVDPYNSFYEWVKYFCGPDRIFLCGPSRTNPDDTNEGFIDRLESIYNNSVAPNKIVYVSGGQNQGETVTATATAIVIIGKPPQGPPAYAPLKGPVWRSGTDFSPPTHEGIDIATKGADWNVYSPFIGISTVIDVADDGDCDTNCYGVRVDLKSGEFTVRMAHMERGAVRVKIGDIVGTDTALGVMDDTGTSFGDHVHYEIRKAGELVDPKDYGALVDHP